MAYWPIRLVVGIASRVSRENVDCCLTFCVSTIGLAPGLHAKLADPQNVLLPATRAAIPAELLPKMVEILGDALWCAFLTGLLLMLAGLVISFWISSSTPGATSPSDNALEFSD